jgi:hypothetical protein
MTRRAVIARLDAKLTNPEERVFDFDAVEEVKAQRPQLVIDALTVVRAYLLAGQPVQLPAFGSFDDWNMVRGAMVWLGCADPFETKASVKAENPELEEKAELFRMLLKTFEPGQGFTIWQLSAMSDDMENAKTDLSRLLRDGRWDAKRAGHLLRRHKDVPFLGVTLVSQTNALNAQEYRLEGDPDAALGRHRSLDVF